MASYLVFFQTDVAAAANISTWPIIPTMALGSFVAGSTFLGGGAVAFPVMTKLLAIDPELAKQFSLAIQCVGMSSASMLIIAFGRALPYRAILIAIAFAAFGSVISLTWLDKLFNSADLKIGFSLFILCFLLVSYLAKSSRFDHLPTAFDRTPGLTMWVLLAAGSFLGGCVSGLLGSGADLFSFCVLFLVWRVPFKKAIQCSVIVMAGCSLIAFSFLHFTERLISTNTLSYNSETDLQALWLLAAPVVLIGAPAGVLFCRLIAEKTLARFIFIIAGIELLSTVVLVEIVPHKIPIYFAVAGFVILFLLAIHRYGLKVTTKD